MGYKSNRGKGAIANARVNKLPRKQASWNNPSKSSKDSCRLGGLRPKKTIRSDAPMAPSGAFFLLML